MKRIYIFLALFCTVCTNTVSAQFLSASFQEDYWYRFKSAQPSVDNTWVFAADSRNGDPAPHILKTDSTGQILWSYTVDGIPSIQIMGLLTHSDGSIFLAASILRCSFTGSAENTVQMLDQHGHVLWRNDSIQLPFLTTAITNDIIFSKDSTSIWGATDYNVYRINTANGAIVENYPVFSNVKKMILNPFNPDQLILVGTDNVLLWENGVTVKTLLNESLPYYNAPASAQLNPANNDLIIIYNQGQVSLIKIAEETWQSLSIWPSPYDVYFYENKTAFICPNGEIQVFENNDYLTKTDAYQLKGIEEARDIHGLSYQNNIVYYGSLPKQNQADEIVFFINGSAAFVRTYDTNGNPFGATADAGVTDIRFDSHPIGYKTDDLTDSYDIEIQSCTVRIQNFGSTVLNSVYLMGNSYQNFACTQEIPALIKIEGMQLLPGRDTLITLDDFLEKGRPSDFKLCFSTSSPNGLPDADETNNTYCDNRSFYTYPYPNTLHVFPMPAQDELVITVAEQNLYAIEYGIFSVSGTVVKKGVLPSDNDYYYLNISDLQPGLYFLGVGSDMVKFVKTN